MVSPERALNRSKKLIHLHLVGFKFVGNVPNLADQNDGSPQSTEIKEVASLKDESAHMLRLE